MDEFKTSTIEEEFKRPHIEIDDIEKDPYDEEDQEQEEQEEEQEEQEDQEDEYQQEKISKF